MDRMSEDDNDSQPDMFANTQANPEPMDITKNFEFPWLILFLWSGQSEPFTMVPLIDLDPLDIDSKWLSAILSSKSRCKHRHFKNYPDFAVSIFSKVHISKLYIYIFFGF